MRIRLRPFIYAIVVLGLCAPAARAQTTGASAPAPTADPKSITMPAYPEEARIMGEQGNTDLLISVDAGGKVSEVKVKKSSGSETLDEAAIAHVKNNWKFKPAMSDGKAIASSTTATMEWKLETPPVMPVVGKIFVTKTYKEEKAVIDRMRYMSRRKYSPNHISDIKNYEEFLTVLHISRWQPRYFSADGYWYDLAEILVEKGEVEKAKSVARRITSPTLLVRMKAEKKFDPVTSASPDQFDMDKAVINYIAVSKKNAELASDMLEPINRLATAYIIGKRPQDALSLLDKTIAEVNGAPSGKSRFADIDPFNWTLELRASALRYLGRDQESLIQLLKAGEQREAYKGYSNLRRSFRNVSQNLNYAFVAVDMGDPEAARAALNKTSGLSSYGVMVLKYVQACSNHQRGTSERTDALNYMRRHINDGPYTYIQALMCAGEMDAAADVFIEMATREKWRPEDLGWRNGIFIRCQKSNDQTYKDRFVSQNWVKLCARPDVIAALNVKGRIGSYPNMNLLFDDL